MRAKYIGAKKKKGIRGAVYRHAEEHNAYYSLESSKSIFYNDDDDLQIVLLFHQEEGADLFCTFLSQWYLNNPMVVKYGDVVVNDTKVLFIYHSSMERVKLAHYTLQFKHLRNFVQFQRQIQQKSVHSVSLPLLHSFSL